MDILAQDLRYAIRSLRAAPGFTIVVVLTLALGIGANTAIFSVINEMLLRSPDVAEPERVVAVYTSDFSSGPYGTTSIPDFRDFRDQSQALSSLAAFQQGFLLNLQVKDDTVRVPVALVSGEFFELLGASAHRGRLLTSDDTDPAAAPKAVLGHGLWRERFAEQGDILGRKVVLDGTPMTVVGVAPPGFRGTRLGGVPEVWLPLSQVDIVYPGFGSRLTEQRGGRWLAMVGRLADGASVEQAQVELTTIMGRLAEEYPSSNLGTLEQPDKPRPITVLPAIDAALGGGARAPAERRARFLMAIVGLVLLTACANVANLVLSQGRRRQTELAVRLSLGAHHGRLVRQLLTESLLLSLLGGAVGLLFAQAIGRVLIPLGLTTAIASSAVVPGPRLDAAVLLFALAASLVTSLLFGLLPALWASRPDLVPALKSGSGSFETKARRIHGRDLLVVAQIAGSIVLMIGAGLFVRSLQKAYAVDLGFDPENVLLVSVDPGSQGLDRDQQRGFYAELRRQASALPGVEAAALARTLPVSPSGSRSTVRVDGYQPADGEDMELNFNTVTPGYFEALGIPILRGRGFAQGDSAEAPRVAVVNQAFAERYWSGQNPIGKRLYGGGEDSPSIEVVGLATTSKYRNIREDPIPYIYYPMAQVTRDSVTLAIRARAFPLELFGPVRDTVRSLQVGMPVFDIRTLEQHQGIALDQERNIAILVSVLGFLALLIAAVGVYGVMSNAVSQRTRELGIRSALGARTGDIASMILIHAVRLSVVGTLVGVMLAWANRSFVADFLFGVSASDPVTFIAVAGLLVTVAVSASILPAWRATRVDPLVAVQGE